MKHGGFDVLRFEIISDSLIVLKWIEGTYRIRTYGISPLYASKAVTFPSLYNGPNLTQIPTATLLRNYAPKMDYMLYIKVWMHRIIAGIGITNALCSMTAAQVSAATLKTTFSRSSNYPNSSNQCRRQARRHYNVEPFRPSRWSKRCYRHQRLRIAPTAQCSCGNGIESIYHLLTDYARPNIHNYRVHMLLTASQIYHEQSTEDWYQHQITPKHRVFQPSPPRLRHEPGIYLYPVLRLTTSCQSALKTLTINLHRHAVGYKGCGSERFANGHCPS